MNYGPNDLAEFRTMPEVELDRAIRKLTEKLENCKLADIPDTDAKREAATLRIQLAGSLAGAQ